MAIEIGSKGLAERDLVIPQGTSLPFNIIHRDENGNVIDHSDSTVVMAFQDKKTGEQIQLDDCVMCSPDMISVYISGDKTKDLPLGKNMLWDIIVTMDNGEITRLIYGKVEIVDTYALDER